MTRTVRSCKMEMKTRNQQRSLIASLTSTVTKTPSIWFVSHKQIWVNRAILVEPSMSYLTSNQNITDIFVFVIFPGLDSLSVFSSRFFVFLWLSDFCSVRWATQVERKCVGKSESLGRYSNVFQMLAIKNRNTMLRIYANATVCSDRRMTHTRQANERVWIFR